MTRFDMVMALIMTQLEINRQAIDDPNVEQMTLTVKFKPHGGVPRSVQVGCLHVYDGRPDTPEVRVPA